MTSTEKAFEKIRKVYNVPARIGARVSYKPDKPGSESRKGTIVGVEIISDHLKIKFDGDSETYPALFHPQWDLTYLQPF